MELCTTKMRFMLDWLRVQFTKAHIKETIVNGFAVFGVIKAVFEFSDYFFKGQPFVHYINLFKGWFSEHILYCGLAIIAIVFIVCKRKTSFSWKINGTNLSVEISLCNFFHQEGLKIIHVTDTFDTDYSLEGLIDSKTLHGQFLNKHRNKIVEINHKIENGLKRCKKTKKNDLPAKKYIYSIGTVAMVNVDNEHYALVAYSRMQPDKHAKMPQDQMEYNHFLVNMWINLAQKATTDETVNVVVFGEGLNRMPALFTKQKKIGEIIRSFIICSLEGVSYKKLRICLKYNKKENIHEFEKLRYLQYEYDSYNVSSGDIPVGRAIS